MASRNLEYIVSLTDQLSPEIRKIAKEMDRLGGQGQQAINRMAHGWVGLKGIGTEVISSLQPAIEMSNEIGKIRGLGETEEGLELLERRALAFSTQWGESATQFVDASYDIKSAIDGLTAEELVGFTEISAVTGKATQTDGKVMTDYLGTMYSVLGAAKEADKIQWAQNLMAQTAYTANKFKSDGAKIAQAFSTLGNQATLAGVKINEQFAILGTLQNEMGGGESATKYSAFLNSIGTAGDKLGMNFRDVNGMLKSTPEILAQIKQKYGDVIDDRESAELKKALGRKEGLDFIKALIGKTDDLGNSIAEIGKINGLDEVLEGARANIDVFKRLSGIIDGVRIAIGGQLLKVLDPFLQKLADVGSYMVDWLKVNKYVARLIGLILGGIAALAAMASMVTLLSGLFSLVKVGIMIFSAMAIPVAILAIKIAAVAAVIYLFRKQIAQFVSGFIAGFKSVGLSFEPLTQAFSTLFSTIGQIINRLTGSENTWTGWARLGEAAGSLIAGGLNLIVQGLAFIINTAALVLDVFTGVFDDVVTTWDNVAQAFSNGNVLLGFVELGNGIIKIFENAFDKVWAGILKGLNVAIGWLNNLGANITPIEIPVTMDAPALPVQGVGMQAGEMKQASAVTGGMMNFAGDLAKSKLTVEGTNAKSLAQPKQQKGIASQISQNKTANITNHITINGENAGKQANNYIKAQEQAHLSA